MKRVYTGVYTATVTQVTHAVYVWDSTTGETAAEYAVG